MQFAEGDMWRIWNVTDLFLFTGNGVLTQDNKLVMGGGIAKQVRDRCKNSDAAIGRYLLDNGNPVDGFAQRVYWYGLIVSPRWPEARLGSFQTKLHWRDPSTLDMIERSAKVLAKWCTEHPKARVDLAYPGIGLGGLNRSGVQPVLRRHLDDKNVWLWTYKK